MISATTAALLYLLGIVIFTFWMNVYPKFQHFTVEGGIGQLITYVML